MIKIRPYKMGSKSAFLLATAMSELLGQRVLRTINPQFLRRHKVINWGSGEFFAANQVLNPAIHVRDAINKYSSLCRLGDVSVPTPEWTTDKEAARVWSRNGDVVYCRKILEGSEGRGIVIARTPTELVDAPLYTKRFKSSKEYRVHVAFGEAIQVVQKKRRRGSNADPFIRSNNDWVFARNIDPVPDCVVREAVRAVGALNLDFGAVDVLYSVRTNKPCVLEVNTAPGLDETSARIYAAKFVERI